MRKQYNMIMLTLFLNVIFAIALIGTLTSTPASSVLAAGVSEPFEDIVANWIVETDVNGTGATVTRSNTQKRAGMYSAASFTTNSGAKAQVRDIISSTWSSVQMDTSSYIWQRAYVYVPSATANALTGGEYLDLGGLYVSGNLSGYYLRLKASGALYAAGPVSSGQAEFNLYGTFPLDQWVEVELGLWSRNTGDLDRAGCFIINGKFYGWFTNGTSGTDYNRAAMGIVATNSADDLMVYIDDWYIYTTGTGSSGTDNRPTGTTYTKDYTLQSGENVGYHYTTWENGYILQPNYGLSPSTRIQSSIETSRMPDLSNGWSQIVIDWAGGNTPPWPPDLIGPFFGPMIGFRKSVELEENLEVVPVYRSATGSVDLVFESWTIGPIEYATWQLPLDGSGHRIPGRGDIIRVKWQEVSATQLRVRVDYYDASAGTWTTDAIDHTHTLNNVNGVNFLADTHRAVTNTIDSNDYTIESQTIGTLTPFPVVTQITRADPSPTNAASIHFNVIFSTPVIGVDQNDFNLTAAGVTGATITAVSGSGATYTVTVNTGSGNGTIRLDVVDDNTIIDAANNPLGGVNFEDGNFTTGEVYTVIKSTDVNVTIGGASMGPYPMQPGTSLVKTYSGVVGGPVVIQSNNGAKIIASTQQLRRNDMTQNLWPGIIQIMGMQAENLSDTYVIPRYSNLDPATKYEIIPISNFDTFDTNVTVQIGSTIYGPYPVAKGTIYAFNQAVEGGPVVVSSDNGAQIIASLYQLKRAVSTSKWTGQSEMLGIPLLQLSTSYVFPFYDYTSLGLQPSLNIANADSKDTNISVKIGNTTYGPYPVAVGTSLVKTYPGILGGPVVVSSDNGAKIIASSFQLRRIDLTVNLWSGIAQAMGVQAGNLSDTYVIPRYTNLDPATKFEIIPISNFDTFDTHVTVKIGSTTYGPYAVAKGTIYAFNQAVEGGPVVVSSDNGAQIIVSLYQLKRAVSTTRWNDQSEMMGIAWLQLSDTYVFPFYDYTSLGLLPSLIFAVP